MVAIRNIYRNKLRNVLTILGVAAGISVFVTSLSVGDGFKTQVRDIIKRYHIDITVQSKGAGTPLASRIPLSEYEGLRQIPGVADASSLILGTLKTPWNPYFVVAGITANEALAGKFSVVEGRSLTAGRREIMLGKLAAQQFGYHAGNKIVLIKDEVFSVSGIYSFGSRIMDGAVVLDISEAQRLLKSDRYINMAFLQVTPGRDPRQIIEMLHKRFPDLSALLGGDFAGQVRLFNTVDLFAWVVSLISLFTCCIVVMNTLFMAISERTKEIGVLMAIGWSRFRIFRTILCEALIICLAGGVAGNLAGRVFFLAFLNRTNVVGIGWIPSAIPPGITLQSLGLSLLLGFLSSLYPAFVASRLLPADALRYE